MSKKPTFHIVMTSARDNQGKISFVFTKYNHFNNSIMKDLGFKNDCIKFLRSLPYGCMNEIWSKNSNKLLPTKSKAIKILLNKI